MDQKIRDIIVEDVNIHSAAKIGKTFICPSGNKYAAGMWEVLDWDDKYHFFDDRKEALNFFFAINKV